MGLRPIANKCALAALLVISAQITLAELFPRTFWLTAFGDLTQCLLLIAAFVAIHSNATVASGRAKSFWALMTLGFGMWLASQLLWTYFEVILRREVPNPFVGDIVLFLHIVPMMAALGIQPHTHRDDQLTRVNSLDFLLLLIWWLYLFLFVVIPWHYVYPNEEMYGRCFDALYFSEHLVLLCGLGFLWRNSVGSWRFLYAQLFGAASLYAAGSIAASIAIDYHLYYTGSIYDVPLVVAILWFVGIGLSARRMSQKSQFQKTPAQHGIWAARLAMITVISTPLMVAWAVYGGNAPPAIRRYRLLLTLATMLVMGFLVFLKQHLLDRGLIRLLHASQQTLEEMRGLKDELMKKESMLSWQSMELQRKNLELQEASYTDTLTGLWNRRYLEETLAAEAGQVLRSYQRAGTSATGAVDHRDLVLLMVDVDFFKRVNDDYGHPVGDALLRKVAERLTRIMRKSDVLIRWGGEEFMILTRSADRNEITVFCSRILETMASEPFDLISGVTVQKTCSIGWAPYPWSQKDYESLCAEEVVELADAALYRAKALGRNRSVGYVPSNRAMASAHRITIDSLRNEKTEWIQEVLTLGSTNAGSTGSPEGSEVRTKP